ncbi:MAG TPA: Ig-like domain-containing protein [Candidatus Bathyarchaeia archaeon]|nr:Ig-like domain-containing protein [Candidatus Bathyarchaeia archaeon]
MENNLPSADQEERQLPLWKRSFKNFLISRRAKILFRFLVILAFLVFISSTLLTLNRSLLAFQLFGFASRESWNAFSKLVLSLDCLLMVIVLFLIPRSDSLRPVIIRQLKEKISRWGLFFRSKAVFFRDWLLKFKRASSRDKWLMSRKYLFFLILVLVLLETVPYFFPPRIVKTFPADGARETPLDAIIEVVFDRPMQQKLTERGLKISPDVSGVVSWQGNTLVFEPKQPFGRGQVYQVSFEKAPRSSFLIPLLGKRIFSFETAGNPKVILASPLFEALEEKTPITVMFDRAMVPLTTATGSAVLASSLVIEPTVVGEGRWLGTSAYQYRPQNPYPKATDFKVTVLAGLESQDGGVMSQEYSWTFSSERPKILAVSPQPGYNFASPTASIAAYFSQLPEPDSAKDKFLVRNKEGKLINGSLQVKDNWLGFYPNSLLDREERYEVEILPGIEGQEGPNGLESRYAWGFMTAALPAVTGSDPASGAQNVSQEHLILVFFKTPMRQDSFTGHIHLSPQPEKEPTFYFSSYQDNRLQINTYLKRSTTYTVTIDSEVTDQYNVPLGSPFRFQFTTGDYPPSISIVPSGTYFAAFNQEIVPRLVTKVVNQKEVDYSLYKLSREQFLDLYRRRSDGNRGPSYYTWQDYDPRSLEEVNRWAENFEIEKNVPVHVITKVTDRNGQNLTPGFYFLDASFGDSANLSGNLITGVQAAGPGPAHDNLVMIVSRLTILAKKSDNQIFAWVVDQSTGQPVAGVKIELTDQWGSLLTEGTTNQDGVFQKEVDLYQKDNLFLFGQKENDLVVLSTAWDSGIERYDFGLPYHYSSSEAKDWQVKKDYKIYLTIDRPIYRPGQTVYFKGLIREDNDGLYQKLSQEEKINFKIVDSRQRTVFDRQLPLNGYGGFSDQFEISSQANLGYYQTEVNFAGNSFSQQFQVEEYRRPDFLVTTKPQKENYVSGEVAKIDVQARYYFGAPMGGRKVTWSAATQDYDFRWDKDYRFEFGDPESYWSQPWWYYSSSDYYFGEELTQGKGETDSSGNLTVSIPLDLSQKKTSQKIKIEATVSDESNQVIAGSDDFLAHKGSLYLGLRPQSYTNRMDKEVQVEVVIVDSQGKEKSDVPVTVEFYKRTWNSVKEKNPDDGQFYWVSKPKDNLVATQEAVTGSTGRTGAAFTPGEGGSYRVVGKTNDSSGNLIQSATFLWVSGYGFSPIRENHDRIVLVTDKDEYLVGEKPQVFVASPFDQAKALVTVERAWVLDYKIADISSDNSLLEIEAKPRFSPNSFVSVALIKGGREVKDPPQFKIGYREIRITDQSQKVEVTIETDKAKYLPRDKIKAKLKTRNALGYPVKTELAVALVDRAVWDLSGVELADIYETFYQPRNLEVTNSQLLTISLDRINANINLGSKGGSGGGCFLPETQILVRGGSSKRIDEIQVGDIILTREDIESTRLVEARVEKVFVHQVNEYLLVNGNLRVTPVHRLFVNNRWQIAGDLKVGDKLVDYTGQAVEVFSIEEKYGSFKVYNLQIADYRTYFANGFWVHNQKGNGFETARTDFPATAYWNPHLETNDQGEVEIEVDLPDNLTTWRLSAVAVSQETAVGSAVHEILATKEVLIRPLMPRFVSSGDQPDLGVIVVNTSDQNQEVTVKLEGEGFTIVAKRDQQQVVGVGGQQKFSWPVTVTAKDKVKVRLSAEGNSQQFQDRVELELPVVSFSTPEVTATSGEAADVAQEKIFLPAEVDQTQGALSVSLSPSLSAGAQQGFSYLKSFPYECAEQIASRLLSASLISQAMSQAQTDKAGNLTRQQLEAVASVAVQKLNNSQHPDGGWGWWIESETDPFISAYVLQALWQANQSKFVVDQSTIEKTANYLQGQLASSSSYRLTLDVRAFVLHVLNLTGFKNESYLTSLYEKRYQLNLAGRAYLAMAMQGTNLSQEQKRILGDLVSLVKKTSTGSHWEEPTPAYYLMGSNNTTTAVILEMLTMVDPKNPLIDEVVRYLMANRYEGHWRCTRETATIILGLMKQFLTAGEGKIDYEYDVTLNQEKILSGKFTKENLFDLVEKELTIGELKIGEDNPFQIGKSGQGKLYYNLDLSYFLPFEKIDALERGMVIVRELVDSRGKVLNQEKVSAGQDYWVRLTVVAPQESHYVIIEDKLPAGFESVNESLKTTNILNVDRPPFKEEANRFWYFNHQELRDDRTVLFADWLPQGVYEYSYRVRATLPGRYHYPPAQVYQMYFPDVFGHSSGDWLVIE